MLKSGLVEEASCTSRRLVVDPDETLIPVALLVWMCCVCMCFAWTKINETKVFIYVRCFSFVVISSLHKQSDNMPGSLCFFPDILGLL